MLKSILIIVCGTNALFYMPAYRALINRSINPGSLFSKKPFTCVFCMAYWIATLSCFIVPLMLGKPVHIDVIIIAPFLAELVNRYFKSLPVTL